MEGSERRVHKSERRTAKEDRYGSRTPAEPGRESTLGKYGLRVGGRGRRRGPGVHTRPLLQVLTPLRGGLALTHLTHLAGEARHGPCAAHAETAVPKAIVLDRQAGCRIRTGALRNALRTASSNAAVSVLRLSRPPPAPASRRSSGRSPSGPVDRRWSGPYPGRSPAGDATRAPSLRALLRGRARALGERVGQQPADVGVDRVVPRRAVRPMPAEFLRGLWLQ